MENLFSFFTKRPRTPRNAASILPLEEARIALQEKISHLEEIYDRHDKSQLSCINVSGGKKLKGLSLIIWLSSNSISIGLVCHNNYSLTRDYERIVESIGTYEASILYNRAVNAIDAYGEKLLNDTLKSSKRLYQIEAKSVRV